MPLLETQKNLHVHSPNIIIIINLVIVSLAEECLVNHSDGRIPYEL